MDLSDIVGVFLVGAAGGGLAGLLGIGGAVVVVPALVFLAGLPIHQATGTSIVQALASSLTAIWQYSGQRTIDTATAIPMAAAAVIGGLVGGLFVQEVAPEILTLILLGMVLLALVLIALPSGRADDSAYHLFGGAHRPNVLLAVVLGGGTGALAGLLGAGGGFLMLPLMNAVLRMPLRVAIPSSLVVVAATTSSGFVGRVLAGQVEPVLGVAVTLGAVPMAILGSRIGRRTPTRWLRLLLAILLVLIAARLAFSLLYA